MEKISGSSSDETTVHLFLYKRRRVFLFLLVGTIFLIIYILHRMESKINTSGDVKMPLETMQRIVFKEEIWSTKGGIPYSRKHVEGGQRDEEVKSIMARLDRKMPHLSFSSISPITSAKKSRASLLNPKDAYCTGEQLLVQLDLHDRAGRRKMYGGDFLRVRISSSGNHAGASGHITDYGNGTYLVNFTLFWEGTIDVSLLLFHPSEGVSALWAARKKGYSKITFRGRFLNGTSEVFTECGFAMNTTGELCEYVDERDKEFFYCLKRTNVPCASLLRLKSRNTPISYVTPLEKHLFKRISVAVEIPKAFGKIHVIPCESELIFQTVINFTNSCMLNSIFCLPHIHISSSSFGKPITVRKKCKLGINSSSPSGFVWQNQWYPAYCRMSRINTMEKINTCLKGKLLYFFGDSTLWQWADYLTKRVIGLKFLGKPTLAKTPQMSVISLDQNIHILWKKHGLPLIGSVEYTVEDHSYVAREIDRVAGSKDTAIVFCLGQHFRPFPIELFIRRMINIREAIQRLLLRSPETKVIIKSENIRELNTDIERFGDFHGYTQFLAVKDIFQGLNVVFIDAWDMTIAYGTTNVHPPQHVVENQINLFLVSIC